MKYFQGNSVLTLLVLLDLLVLCTCAAYQLITACDTVDNATLVCDDNIPPSVPVGILNVVLKDFQGSLTIDETTFKGHGWGNIKNLTLYHQCKHNCSINITSKGFASLQKLTELHLHLGLYNLEEGFLDPLQKLTELDLSDCIFLQQDDFGAIFHKNTSLPMLYKLVLVNAANDMGDGLCFTDTVLHAIYMRPVTYIDVSGAVVSESNLTAINMYCDKFEYFFCRKTTVKHTYQDHHYLPKICKSLKLLDVSQLVTTKLGYCLISGFSNEHNFTIPTNMTYSYIKTFLYAQKLYVNNLCNNLLVPKVCRNITAVWENIQPQWNIKEISFEQNALQYLDIDVSCKRESINPSVRIMSLRYNGLRFLHPSLLYCFVGYVEVLDLSDNNLGQMCEHNASLFESLFSSLSRLRSLNLNNNHIEEESSLNLSKNTKLEHLTLSNNKIRNVHIKFSQVNRIQFLDVSFNRLKVLDHQSQNNLEKLVISPANRNLSIFLEGNPFVCYECSHLESVNWLHTHSLYIKDFKGLTCSNSQRKLVPVDQSIIDDLSKMCAKPRIITAVSISSSAILALLVTIVIVMKLKKRQLNVRNRQQFLKHIREAPNETDFLVFLSHSSKDDDFVNWHVNNALHESLKQAVGVVKTLVCTGDTHFRLGRTIHDEMVHWISKSFAVVIILTDHYLQSAYCQIEFQQAHLLRKPVILMIKGRVTVDLMPTAMAELYHTYVRIHWVTINGQAVLKTSWNKVCDSIIDLAIEGYKKYGN